MCFIREFLQKRHSIVARAIVADNEFVRRMGLLRYRAQLLLQEWSTIVGGQSYRDFADASIFARTRDIRKAVIGQRGNSSGAIGNGRTEECSPFA